MAFKFCPECGSAIEPGARFCTGCGLPLGGMRAASALPATGVVALAVLLLLGGGFWLYYRLAPAPDRPLKPGEGRVAAAPPGAPPGTATDPATGQPHPPIELPEDIKQYIANLEKNAKEKPQDVAAWQTLARVQYRASRLDPSYGPPALASFQHLLEIDPNNLEALRGLGNIAYDRQDRDQAIDYYRKYLAQKPDDPEVRTDLGTMLFENGDPEGSEREFKQVIEKHPQFFQAHFNLGIVYEARGDREAAKRQLEKARDLATDEAIKQRIGVLITAAEQNVPFTEAAEQFVAQAQAQAQAQPPAAAIRAPALVQPHDIGRTLQEWFGQPPRRAQASLAGDATAQPAADGPQRQAAQPAADAGPASIDAAAMDVLAPRNLLRLADELRPPWRDAAYLLSGVHRAIRTAQWYLRAVWLPDAQGWSGQELFHKPDDRWEVNDVAVRCPRELEELTGRLTALRCASR